ncbi:MAG: type I-B CRISPR-associated protein Cas7/Cst2/DevR [Nitrospirota bacterium]
MTKENTEENNPRYLVLDIVFRGGALNYDQGSQNQKELKKITMYDGSVHILVSKYALRYSILENGAQNGFWDLAGKKDLTLDKKVVQANENLLGNGQIINIPEFDLFGYLVTKKKEKKEKVKFSVEKSADSLKAELKSRSLPDLSDEDVKKVVENDVKKIADYKFKIKDNQIDVEYAPKKNKKESEDSEITGEEDGAGGNYARVAPVKISHAISLNPYNFDSHFTANLGVMKRAGGSGSNPVTMEDFYGFYVYNVTVDLNRIGKATKDETGANEINVSPEEKKERVQSLLRTLMYLKRDIAGKREDLSPLLVVSGVYADTCYDSFIDKIELASKHESLVVRGEKDLGGGKKEIFYSKQDKNKPKFIVHGLSSRQSVYHPTWVECEGAGAAGKDDGKDNFIDKLTKRVEKAYPEKS